MTHSDKWNQISKDLKMCLGVEHISNRAGPGGKKLSYIEHYKATNLANEIFGFDGWSNSIMDLQVDFCDQDDKGMVSCGVSAIVRVTLTNGAYHEDLGYGSMDNARSKSLALQKAKKEAVSDGTKRALRNFGNCLGNCLYNKEFLNAISKINHRPTPTKFEFYNPPTKSDCSPKSTIPLIEKVIKTNTNPINLNPNLPAGNKDSVLNDSVLIEDEFAMPDDFDSIDIELLNDISPPSNIQDSISTTSLKRTYNTESSKSPQQLESISNHLKKKDSPNIKHNPALRLKSNYNTKQLDLNSEIKINNSDIQQSFSSVIKHSQSKKAPEYLIDQKKMKTAHRFSI